jgi:hypothetical protein
MKPAALLLVFLVLGHSSSSCKASDPEALKEKAECPLIDRVRLAEAFAIGETLGESVWKGWHETPFAVLLVTPEHEFLFRHPAPSPDFVSIGHDPLLKSEVFARKRTLQTNLLATFPAVPGSPVSTIVIGQAENTAKKTSTPWVVTVLHEHFHQLQQSQPSYYTDVAALNLSRGDQSGMWMLNYEFPYESAEVGERFQTMSRLLAETLKETRQGPFEHKLRAYREARRQFGSGLLRDDYKYFSFQVWQEGIARYTEYRIAQIAAKEHAPSPAFAALTDYKPFGEVAEEIHARILIELSTLDLDDYRRVAFYPLGAGEAMLLDRARPGWQDRYLVHRFYVDRYLDAQK